jgi:hypothetical protein
MRRHRTDGVSLGFGLLFLAIAFWWVVGQYVDLEVPNLGWIVAAGLIVLGVVGVIGSLFGRGREEPQPAEAQAPYLGEAQAPYLSEAPAPYLSEAQAPPLSEAEEPHPSWTDEPRYSEPGGEPSPGEPSRGGPSPGERHLGEADARRSDQPPQDEPVDRPADTVPREPVDDPPGR